MKKVQGAKKVTYEIDFIDKETALELVKRYHYSNTLPRLNKHFVGFKLDGELVGMVTLGWGTRPLHTIQKLFPTLETKDYFEIGRMVMIEEMERNSESQMLSQLVKFLKVNFPELKVLFTWSDGMLGKVGYVYQASNFEYAGFYETDTYMKDGKKLHPRQTKAIFSKGKDDKRLTARPTLQQMNEYGIKHVKGKQFKYVYFLCPKNEAKELRKNATVPITRDYPKEKDLRWRVKDEHGKWHVSEMPFYETDLDQNNVETFIKGVSA